MSNRRPYSLAITIVASLIAGLAFSLVYLICSTVTVTQTLQHAEWTSDWITFQAGIVIFYFTPAASMAAFIGAVVILFGIDLWVRWSGTEKPISWKSKLWVTIFLGTMVGWPLAKYVGNPLILEHEHCGEIAGGFAGFISASYFSYMVYWRKLT
jgi:hypothetical protein